MCPFFIFFFSIFQFRRHRRSVGFVIRRRRWKKKHNKIMYRRVPSSDRIHRCWAIFHFASIFYLLSLSQSLSLLTLSLAFIVFFWSFAFQSHAEYPCKRVYHFAFAYFRTRNVLNAGHSTFDVNKKRCQKFNTVHIAVSTNGEKKVSTTINIHIHIHYFHMCTVQCVQSV